MSRGDRSMAKRPNEKSYWLDRKENVAKVYYTLCALCVALFFFDFFYHEHAAFAVEEWFGFYAIYGFVGAVVLVLAAKQLRRILMRSEDHYER